MKKPRNRAAQDVNLINLRALKKRVKLMETKWSFFEKLHFATAPHSTLGEYFKKEIGR